MFLTAIGVCQPKRLEMCTSMDVGRPGSVHDSRSEIQLQMVNLILTKKNFNKERLIIEGGFGQLKPQLSILQHVCQVKWRMCQNKI
nr:unnamed protein product [Callosobruchus analis]